MSRPAVDRMIDAGKLIARLVGSERHVLLDDLLAQRDAAAAKRRTAIDEMTQNAEELGLYEFGPIRVMTPPVPATPLNPQNTGSEVHSVHDPRMAAHHLDRAGPGASPRRASPA